MKINNDITYYIIVLYHYLLLLIISQFFNSFDKDQDFRYICKFKKLYWRGISENSFRRLTTKSCLIRNKIKKM